MPLYRKRPVTIEAQRSFADTEYSKIPQPQPPADLHPLEAPRISARIDHAVRTRNPHGERIVGVDRLTALVLEARHAIEACRIDGQPWQYCDRATFETAYGPIGGPLAYADTDSVSA